MLNGRNQNFQYNSLYDIIYNRIQNYPTPMIRIVK